MIHIHIPPRPLPPGKNHPKETPHPPVTTLIILTDSHNLRINSRRISTSRTPSPPRHTTDVQRGGTIADHLLAEVAVVLSLSAHAWGLAVVELHDAIGDVDQARGGGGGLAAVFDFVVVGASSGGGKVEGAPEGGVGERGEGIEGLERVGEGFVGGEVKRGGSGRDGS